jgi:hypothetical protein
MSKPPAPQHRRSFRPPTVSVHVADEVRSAEKRIAIDATTK